MTRATSHRALATCHLQLAEAFEAHPDLLPVWSGPVERRLNDGRTLQRPEIWLGWTPATRPWADGPRRCPWIEDLEEATLPEGPVVLWVSGSPARPAALGLAKRLRAEDHARRAGAVVLRRFQSGDKPDSLMVSRLLDRVDVLPAGPLREGLEPLCVGLHSPAGPDAGTLARAAAALELPWEEASHEAA
ncbi:MAG: hypothetical protein H6739_07750 [Alphaproteobacteria bacterium]|nr:hypothetical protein [Alphaproteobacteria bacterium]